MIRRLIGRFDRWIRELLPKAEAKPVEVEWILPGVAREVPPGVTCYKCGRQYDFEEGYDLPSGYYYGSSSYRFCKCGCLLIFEGFGKEGVAYD